MTSIRKASLPSAAIAIPLLVAVGLAVFATATLGAIAGILTGLGAALAAAVIVGVAALATLVAPLFTGPAPEREEVSM